MFVRHDLSLLSLGTPCKYVKENVKKDSEHITERLNIKCSTILQEMSATTDPAQRAMWMKWMWEGHVARLRDDRWTQKITMWDSYIGRRYRGDQDVDGQISSEKKQEVMYENNNISN